MNNGTQDVILAVAGILLWFAPFQYVEFMNVVGYQSGSHIGGLSYLLLIAYVAYAVFSWKALRPLALVAAATGLGVGLLFAVQVGTSIAWGLIGQVLVLSYASFRAYRLRKVAPARA